MPATLPSNSGNSELRVEFGSPAEYAHDPGFECSIHLHGRHWDGDHSFPFSASIEGIWLRSADLAALRDHIAHWTSRSLEQLVAEDLSGNFELARLPGQSVHLRFGSRPDTISDLNPVVSITISAGAIRGEFHFITDQSCLSLFAQELSGELVGSHENSV
jgi:hypothetical protein